MDFSGAPRSVALAPLAASASAKPDVPVVAESSSHNFVAFSQQLATYLASTANKPSILNVPVLPTLHAVTSTNPTISEIHPDGGTDGLDSADEGDEKAGVGASVDGAAPRKNRMARKAELARSARKRRKCYLQDLESQVKRLTNRVDELESSAGIGSSTGASVAAGLGLGSWQGPSLTAFPLSCDTPSIPQTPIPALSSVQNDELVAAMAIDVDWETSQRLIQTQLTQLVSKPICSVAVGNDSQLSTEDERAIQAVALQFVQNLRHRQMFGLEALENSMDHILPMVGAKFVLWGLDQDDEFYRSDGLWTALMHKELGVTPQQESQIKERRVAMHRERQNFVQTERLLVQLKNHITQTLDSLHAEMDVLLAVYVIMMHSCVGFIGFVFLCGLTPLQLGKMLCWIDQNDWCIQMLGAISVPTATSIATTTATTNTTL